MPQRAGRGSIAFFDADVGEELRIAPDLAACRTRELPVHREMVHVHAETSRPPNQEDDPQLVVRVEVPVLVTNERKRQETFPRGDSNDLQARSADQFLRCIGSYQEMRRPRSRLADLDRECELAALDENRRRAQSRSTIVTL